MFMAETSPKTESRFIGRIPVRNLWLLMLYASELFRSIGPQNINIEDNDEELPDLIAEVLSNAVEKRLHQNLSFGYRLREDHLKRVRGRIDLLTTERHQLLSRGKIACKFETLTIDTPRNRFVLAALEMISKVVSRPELAHRCRKLANGLRTKGVSGVHPTRNELSTDRFGRNDTNDRIMIAAAQLAFEMTMPTEDNGNVNLLAPARDEVWVRHLFEKAIGGFYDATLSQLGWRVNKGKLLRWHITKKSDGIDAILPIMKTDIVIDQPGKVRRIVIDTKFNSIITSGWYRNESLRSGYIYQIYTYLMSQSGSGDPFDQNSCGLLLHPSVEKMIDEVVVIQDHQIRFATVDLTSSAKEIRQRLLDLVDLSLNV